MKLILFDPISRGTHHAAFNSTIVEALLQCNGVSQLIFIGDSSQITHSCFQSIPSNNTLCCIPFPFQKPIRVTRMSWFSNMIRGYVFLHSQLKKTNPDITIFLTADNTFTPLFLWFSQYWKPSSKKHLFIFFHNNLDNIQPGSIKSRLWTRCLSSNRMGIILLADYLKQHTKSLFPASSVYTLPHPTYQHIHKPFLKNNDLEKKNSDFLFLNRQSKEATQSGFMHWFYSQLMTFSSVNRLVTVTTSEQSPAPLMKGVQTNYYSFYPPYSEFLRIVLSTRFVVFPPTSKFRLTASGSLADLISLGVPVIAPKFGPFLEQLPEQAHEYLYDDLEDLALILSKTLTLSSEVYLTLSELLIFHATENDLSATSNCLNQLLTQNE